MRDKHTSWLWRLVGLRVYAFHNDIHRMVRLSIIFCVLTAILNIMTILIRVRVIPQEWIGGAVHQPKIEQSAKHRVQPALR